MEKRLPLKQWQFGLFAVFRTQLNSCWKETEEQRRADSRKAVIETWLHHFIPEYNWLIGLFFLLFSEIDRLYAKKTLDKQWMKHGSIIPFRSLIDSSSLFAVFSKKNACLKEFKQKWRGDSRKAVNKKRIHHSSLDFLVLSIFFAVFIT